jgi:hypothetical protein
MIKTTVTRNYSKPNEATQEAIIELIANETMTPYAILYEVKHYAVLDEENNTKIEIITTNREVSIEKYNQLSQAVNQAIQDFDTTNLTAFEIQQLRLKLGLFIYVTQVDFMPDNVHVAYNLLPNQWILS